MSSCPVSGHNKATALVLVCGQSGCGSTHTEDLPGGIPAPICIVGLNHRSASLDLRSKVGVTGDELPDFLGSCRALGVSECVVLSTCNRTEVYFTGGDPRAVEALLANRAGLDVAEFRNQCYEKHCVCVACHLFKVASGLDSVVLGETEIVAQVKDAWRCAVDAGTSGPMLDFLFQRALEANKRIRTESDLCRNVTSTASLAVQAAGQIAQAKVIVLGAGRLAERVVKELSSAKAKDVRILNRTLERAEILAGKSNTIPLPLSELETQLREADVVFATLSSDEPVLGRALLTRVAAERAGRDLLVIDMGVPRNAEPDLSIPGIRVVDLDALAIASSANADLRAAAVPVALQILDEELHRFGESLVERSAAPTIKSLVAQGEAIKRRNLDWAREKLPNLSEKELGIVEEMARRMMIGLLQAPIDGLKTDPIAREHRHVVERLFGLEGIADA